MFDSTRFLHPRGRALSLRLAVFVRVLLCLCFLLVVPSVAADTAVVSFNPATPTVPYGNQVNVQILISGVTDLAKVDFRIAFDSSIVNVVDIDAVQFGVQILPGNILPYDSPLFNESDNVGGEVHYTILADSSEPFTGNGLIATIVFEAVGGGVSPLTYDFLVLTDAGQLEMPVTGLEGEITVTGGPTATPTETCTPTVTNTPRFLNLPLIFKDLFVPTPTPTATHTYTPTLTPTLTQTPTLTLTPTETSTPTLTLTPTKTTTPTITLTPTETRTPTLTLTPTETTTPTMTLTPSTTPTPTETFTPTATPTETITPTLTVTPTPTWGPGTCYDLIENGDCEADAGWFFPPTEHTAGYSTAFAYSPDRSLGMGLEAGDPNIYSHSAAHNFYPIDVPYDAQQMTLSFWYYCVGDGPFFDPDSNYVYILNEHKVAMYPALLEIHWPETNQQTWLYAEFDETELARFLGQRIYVHFETFNEGTGGKAAFYVDDVIFEVCR